MKTSRTVAAALAAGAASLVLVGAGSASGNRCWGQASAVFAQMGMMGEHASSQEEPRLGLRNLARALHDAGVLPDDSLHSLGVFVSAELGLSIEACSP